MSVFSNLSSVNVNEWTEKKGRFTYLSWSDAWTEIKKAYPNSTSYDLLEDVVYPDGTREVRCSVTIEGQTHMMFLPVMDNNNRAIKNPNAKDMTDARMRCLTKAIAMHGLGLYIYRGEGIPRDIEAQEGQEPLSGYPEPPEGTPEPSREKGIGKNVPQMDLKVEDAASMWMDFYKDLSESQKFADNEDKFQTFMDRRAEKYLSADFNNRLWNAHNTAKRRLMV